ncbi:response regulator transcription factor [Mucilaginibacter sp.]|uniref:response regulator transcription factor n=1 Tax=Mucilaginibacter sp. TaxID=1882438 RepID=UPI002605CBDC|nr:response regulator transcription factor [Mucilaginibacter sp.]MDB5126254.1 helix-turn-helix transcriptional regulator [Mucilaginibacter sp.]
MTLNFWLRNRSVILYGVSLAVLLLLMKWLEWRFIIVDHAFELYAGALAIIFTLLGIWLAVKLTKPKTTTIIVEKEIFVKNDAFILNTNELTRLGLSKRELEVLQLMAEGLSNHQIAERLFVSLNTIKTHSSKVFEKLEVERRTQAIDKAKKLNLIQ